MQHKFYTLDVFTTTRFGGNPLAVVMGADRLTVDEMQVVAREFNLSETIFVMAPDNPAHTAKVRIFFPTAEIPFAGHPTIGCAIHLGEQKNPGTDDFSITITLEEQAGLVPVRVWRMAGDIHAELTAPVTPYAVTLPLPPVSLMAQALGLDEAEIGFDQHEPCVLEGGPRFLYIPVKSLQGLARILVQQPFWNDMLKALPNVDSAYVYTRGGGGVAFQARMFAPTAGTPEDPATGSATAILAAQLLKAEALPDGSHHWLLHQGYEMGRPSDLTLCADVEQGALKAVRLAGQAVRVMQGEIDL